MKRRYLTQRFMYDINRKRVDDQLKKRFGRPRAKMGDTRNVTFIMTVEVACSMIETVSTLIVLDRAGLVCSEKGNANRALLRPRADPAASQPGCTGLGRR
jgi:hypothetical protein